MSKILKTAVLFAASSLAFAPAARAHVVVSPTMAAPGATETLNFIVGHGCSGQPTTALRVELPNTVAAIEPQPKPGWTATVETLPEGGRAITWRGGEPLTKADGFAIKLRLPKLGERLSFVAVQSCGETVVRWDEPVPADGPKPKHPAPGVMLSAPGASAQSQTASALAERLPTGVQRLADGGLADAKGLPLYTFDYDTMVGMSHCEQDCAAMWHPLKAPANAKPMGDWSPISREDGSLQWTYETKPLYTYSKDIAGAAAAGDAIPKWRRAR
jgi:predicted lipoprotein with Yx(FWY)xxD motif